MRKSILFLGLLSGLAWADVMEQKARLEAGQPAYTVQRLDANGRDSDVIEVVDASGKRLWSSLDHPDLPQVGTTGNCEVLDLEGDGRDEILISGGRGPGDTHYAFLQWNGQGLQLHSVGEGFYCAEKPGQRSFRGKGYQDRAERFGLLDNFRRSGNQLKATLWAGMRVNQEVAVRPIPGGFEVLALSPHWKWAQGGSVPLADAFGRPLREADLAGKSARELTLIRNSLYAASGRPFKDPELAAYFKRQSWYSPAAQFSEISMSELTRENARFIQKYQDRYHKNWL